MNATYTIAAATLSDAGSYDVVVSNVVGQTATSGIASLTVNGPISITHQPASATIVAGQPVTFSVTATGSNLHYQWRKDGGNIAGASNSSYTIAAVTTSDTGSYAVVVFNGCNTVTSTAATLR